MEELYYYDPQTYRKDYAETLNNYGMLQFENENYDIAKVNFEKALKIFYELRSEYPDVYSVDVAMVLCNISQYYLKKRDKLKAEKYANELVKMIEPDAVKLIPTSGSSKSSEDLPRPLRYYCIGNMILESIK